MTTTHLVLAADGLAAAKRADAVPALLKLAVDESAATDVRHAAAVALRSLTNAGLTDTGRQLASDQSDQGFVRKRTSPFFPQDVRQITGVRLTTADDACLSHLFEALGRARFSAATYSC